MTKSPQEFSSTQPCQPIPKQSQNPISEQLHLPISEQCNFYQERSNPALKQNNSFTKKVGTTTYIINIHYPDQEKESAKDKLLRIIQADIAKGNMVS